MAKISTNNEIHIRAKSVEKIFLVGVYYNKDMKFFAQVPPEFFDHFNQLDEEKRKEFNAAQSSLHTWNIDKVKHTIKGATEEECLINMENFITYAIDMIAIKRKVIVLSYVGSKIDNRSARKNNPEHPHLELGISLLYCTEVSTGANNNTYCIFDENGGRRQDLDVRKDVTVIDDTEQNRKFVEDVYTKLDILNSALIKFTKTPEVLMQLIASNQKLLG